ncbi:hypothetical protein ACH95_21250 [Bacillus glycinifermentans]|uniref:DUF3953 domain-containing protein n=1 Tax=Bacillus glycinifermentans TaxID=1664069 RepID=A0A0J6HBL4_9BACI|nr:hypothetical protein [Bacillus glycinifermentans]ATH92917.1 hypothetical protein COP00_10140 [Bacillus glycinifermentans]KMM53701.1 hypothetical protein ACH95_21250 [Bacillus glycinifermentans]KRT94130.1 hypothetical protein AB447_202215 [Bacillus glycinifermentans]MEC0486392.1 hypothetical protein [Bacillus glycinifermentans]MEC0493302.1 hypothetical protein [Bacillus glycinifermentans]
MDEDRLGVIEKTAYILSLVFVLVWSFTPESVQLFFKLASFVMLSIGFFLSGYIERKEKNPILLLIAWVIITVYIF